PVTSLSTKEIERAAAEISSHMPVYRITELFKRVDAETSAFSCFTNANGREHHDPDILVAAIWATSLSSTWRSTASYVAAMSLPFASMMWRRAATPWIAPPFARRRQLGRCARVDGPDTNGDRRVSATDGTKAWAV